METSVLNLRKENSSRYLQINRRLRHTHNTYHVSLFFVSLSIWCPNVPYSIQVSSLPQPPFLTNMLKYHILNEIKLVTTCILLLFQDQNHESTKFIKKHLHFCMVSDLTLEDISHQEYQVTLMYKSVGLFPFSLDCVCGHGCLAFHLETGPLFAFVYESGRPVNLGSSSCLSSSCPKSIRTANGCY